MNRLFAFRFLRTESMRNKKFSSKVALEKMFGGKGRRSNRPIALEFRERYRFNVNNVEVVVQTTYTGKVDSNWLRIHRCDDQGQGKYLNGKGNLSGSCNFQRFCVEILRRNIIKLKSSLTGKYVRIKALGSVDCDGNGCKLCEFIVHRQGNGQVKLESSCSRGKYLACDEHGLIITNDTGSIFTFFRRVCTQLDNDIMALMIQLNLPQTARDGILKQPIKQKQIMLNQYKAMLSKRKAESQQNKHFGKEWSNKMIDAKSVNWKLLKEFEVIIKSPEAGATFCTEFIQELGLKRLCRVSREHSNTQFDTQILLIFKAIIDSKQTIIKDIINDDQSVTTIVSKMDSTDHRVREHAIKLLVTLVIAEDTNLSLLAASKIMASLLDSARLKGYRNRWKSVICHLSVNELSGNGSYEYDMYALTLINFIISGLKSIEERTDERRLLNSLKLDESLDKLESKIEDFVKADPLEQPNSENNSNAKKQRSVIKKQSVNLCDYEQYHSLLIEITKYNTYRDEDLNELLKMGVIDDENDLSSPKGLFKVVHDQATDDGNINDLTSILSNLVTIPVSRSGNGIWKNIAKIVQEACQPTQQKYGLQQKEGNDDNKENESENTYLSFKELQHLLKVQKVENENERKIEEKCKQIELQLNEERKRNQELLNIINDLKSGDVPKPKMPSSNDKNKDDHSKQSSSTSIPPPSISIAPTQDDEFEPFRSMLREHLANSDSDKPSRKIKKTIIKSMKKAKICKKVISNFELTGKLPEQSMNVAAVIQDDGLDKFRKMLQDHLKDSMSAKPSKSFKKQMVKEMKKAKVDGAIIMKFEISGKIPESTVAQPKIEEEEKWPQNLKKKRVVTPKRKMKNFQWNKIDPFAVETSIWKECDDTKIKFNSDDFENMFGQKIIAKKQAKTGGGRGRKKKGSVEKIRILKKQRSDNVEIVLKRLKMKPAVCRNILLNMDENQLSVEQVIRLQKHTPTPEESAMFNEVKSDDVENLAKAESFFYTIRDIDEDIPQRLELWVFKMNFDKILAEQSEKVTALSDAILCIQQSNSLRDLFSLILAFGNYMNGGTWNGRAHGFELKSLSQLTQCKSTDNKTTLMEYLYLYILENNKNLLKFIDEWSCLKDGVSVDVSTLGKSVNGIAEKLKSINNRIKNPGKNVEDRFGIVMTPFYVTATKQFEHIKNAHEKVTKDLADLATYLNEKDDKNGQFLKTLNKFRTQFKFTMKQCNERRQREEERRKRDRRNSNKRKPSNAK